MAWEWMRILTCSMLMTLNDINSVSLFLWCGHLETSFTSAVNKDLIVYKNFDLLLIVYMPFPHSAFGFLIFFLLHIWTKQVIFIALWNIIYGVKIKTLHLCVIYMLGVNLEYFLSEWFIFIPDRLSTNYWISPPALGSFSPNIPQHWYKQTIFNCILESQNYRFVWVRRDP